MRTDRTAPIPRQIQGPASLGPFPIAVAATPADSGPSSLVRLLNLPARLIHALARLGWYIKRPVTVGVRVLLIRDNAILLVKHTYQQHWYLPGGGVKKGETLQEAIRREAREEVGIDLRDLTLFGAYSNFGEYKSDHIIVFLCTDFLLRGSPMSSEIEKCCFFDLENLPADISPGTKRRVEEYMRADGLPQIGRW